MDTVCEMFVVEEMRRSVWTLHAVSNCVPSESFPSLKGYQCRRLVLYTSVQKTEIEISKKVKVTCKEGLVELLSKYSRVVLNSKNRTRLVSVCIGRQNSESCTRLTESRFYEGWNRFTKKSISGVELEP